MVSNSIQDNQDKINAKIIFMDLNMPVMDGITATKVIRQREKDNNKNRIVIIGLTGAAYNEDLQNCIDAGMDSVLTKPISIEVLKETISKVIN